MEIKNVEFLLNPFFFCDLQTDASSKAIFSKVMVITSKSVKYLQCLKITVQLYCFLALKIIWGKFIKRHFAAERI